MHEITKAGLLRLGAFIDNYGDGLPDLNAEVSSGKADIHIHLYNVDDLERTHRALGSPTWRVGPSGRSGDVTVDGVEVIIYFGPIVDQTDAQGPLRQLGLVTGLVAL